jgi:hypothetical protein
MGITVAFPAPGGAMTSAVVFRRSAWRKDERASTIGKEIGKDTMLAFMMPL